MAERYWFKRRRHGYGWTPTTAEGWIAVLAFLAVVLGGAGVLALVAPESGVGVAVYLALVVVAVTALLVVTTRHAPPARWRWGRSPDDDPELDR